MASHASQGRYLSRLDAGKSLELGEWLKGHQDILKAHTRTELAHIATADLGFTVSESSVELQGRIRGLETGHNYTRRKPKENPEVVADARLDQIETDILTIAKLLQAYGEGHYGQESVFLERIINRLGDKK